MAREEEESPLPPDPADKEVEESGGQEPHAPKPKRELPKRKKKFRRYTRVGGNRKNTSTARSTATKENSDFSCTPWT